MEFKKVRPRWGSSFFLGKKKNFIFKICFSDLRDNSFYISISHTEKDIRLNTLWIDLTFKTEDEAKKWCEEFDYKNYPCIGKDI